MKLPAILEDQAYPKEGTTSMEYPRSTWNVSAMSDRCRYLKERQFLFWWLSTISVIVDGQFSKRKNSCDKQYEIIFFYQYAFMMDLQFYMSETLQSLPREP